MTAVLSANIASAKEYTSSDVTYNYDTEPQDYKDLNWSYQYNVQEYGNEKLIGAYYKGEYFMYVYNDEGMKDALGMQIGKYTIYIMILNSREVWCK